jgi:hypothetical protein
MKDTLKSHADRNRTTNLESDMITTGKYNADEGDGIEAIGGSGDFMCGHSIHVMVATARCECREHPLSCPEHPSLAELWGKRHSRRPCPAMQQQQSSELPLIGENVDSTFLRECANLKGKKRTLCRLPSLFSYTHETFRRRRLTRTCVKCIEAPWV